MADDSLPKVDTIGPWSEIKLEIIQKYAVAYSTILSSQHQKRNLSYVYIDAFAGAGINFSRTQHKMVPGSPLNALLVEPPFKEFYLIDLDGDKVSNLQETIGDREDVHIFRGDCNVILLKKVFPQVKYGDFRRGLCLLDPYGLHLDWEVIQTAGQMKSIELFLNFPIMDMHRNAFLRNSKEMAADQICRMNRFWGDESWQDVVYQEPPQLNLFPGTKSDVEKIRGNRPILQAFTQRLKKVAGFEHVPEPIVMKNSRGNILYYLFFASPNPTGAKIARDIFKKHKA